MDLHCAIIRAVKVLKDSAQEQKIPTRLYNRHMTEAENTGRSVSSHHGLTMGITSTPIKSSLRDELGML